MSTGPTARACWRADVDRYVLYRTDLEGRLLRRLRIILFTEALWALAVFRFGQYLSEEAPRPLRVLFRAPFGILRKLVELLVGIHLWPGTHIGPGLYIAHYGGIWINPHVTMGANCNLAHGVTIGAPMAAGGAPVLGDRVWIGAGAVITGPIKIGSGAVVGANSLVVASLPENAVAVGVPARVLSYTGSGKLIRVSAQPT